LRNERSLIQTIGRAARNDRGHVILYADRVTGSMERAIFETNRRRERQQRYNEANGITPRTIVRPIENPLAALVAGDYVEVSIDRAVRPKDLPDDVERAQVPRLIDKLRKEMKGHAAALRFEEAAE